MLAHGIQVRLQQGCNLCALQIVDANVHSKALGDQNKKYRCAIGRRIAGSQVSNWPSARTR
jgi:hypothetical protein